MIKFNGVYLSYNGKVIFDDLSMEIKRGDKVVITGKSGIGKSTIFSLFLGFVKPDRGEILFAGEPVTEKNVWRVRRHVAFIDQDVSIGRGRVSEWFGFVSRLRANSSIKHDKDRRKGLFEYFELDDDILKKEMNDLSGGERQRIAVVTSILLGRNVFLLDEVTSSLDMKMKEKLVRFFCSKNGWTVVVISHDSVWLNNPDVRIFDLEERAWKQ